MSLTIAQLQKWKQQKKPIVALTASDYAIAKLLDNAGVDLILVGDSLAMVTLGYKNTLPVTLDDMIRHAQAVGRGLKKALMIVDLPFLSYQISTEEAMRSAGRVFKETEAQGIKLEGGYPDMVKTIRKLVQSGMPVMGHLGLTPQSVHQIGYRVQGNSPKSATEILEQSQALVDAGIFALLLENVPSELATKITESFAIPTIGIGAGKGCDGQILVTHDVLGLSDWQPPFAHKYVDLKAIITSAVQEYCQDVRQSN
ncbi:MAG: 3-methyl-2-oxobutanoate hydroxymethyltransferase [Pseudanabaena sp.]|nr:MAG: 3-methyl-2-oxobutanoate hydroxymethyltransferase [Pseudanabaena sp.]